MPGPTITVSNAVELKKAIASTLVSGGTILLNAGDYGSYTVNGLAARNTVTIKSADPNNDAVFRQLTVNHSSNFVFDDVDVVHPKGIDAKLDAVNVNKSSSISFVGMDISGSLDGNTLNDGRGVVVVASSRIAVLDSTLTQLSCATIFSKSSDVIFAGNTITQVREGVQVGQVDGGLFDHNYIYGMTPNYAAGEHPDAFQVYAANVGASNDLAFRNNVIIARDGPIGGIFIRSEQAKAGIEHSNISIENNYYVGTYRHGISVSDANGVVITGNTVLDSAKAGNSAAIMVTNVDGAKIANNIAPMFINTSSAHVTTANNIDVWEAKTKLGITAAALFAPVSLGNIDFGALNPLGGSVASASGAGFRNVAGIGNLLGTGAAIVSTYVPMFEHSFATHLV